MDVLQILYGWYLEKWHQDEEIVGPYRESFGLEEGEPLSMADFVRRLRNRGRVPRVKQGWIRSWSVAHSSEIVKLPEEVQQFLWDCDANFPPTFLDEAPRELRDAS